jgi:DNA-directed RNA polymerase subunit RPC12/RpoP
MSTLKTALFPCPICGTGLDVRLSKKDKPYVVCNPCGMQLFVRLPLGVQRMNELAEQADRGNIWTRLHEMEGHYRRKCPKCGREFWIHESDVSTSWFDGEFQGYKCPTPGCSGHVPAKEKRK